MSEHPKMSGRLRLTLADVAKAAADAGKQRQGPKPLSEEERQRQLAELAKDKCPLREHVAIMDMKSDTLTELMSMTTATAGGRQSTKQTN
jgi:hypothetical protein